MAGVVSMLLAPGFFSFENEKGKRESINWVLDFVIKGDPFLLGNVDPLISFRDLLLFFAVSKSSAEPEKLAD